MAWGSKFHEMCKSACFVAIWGDFSMKKICEQVFLNLKIANSQLIHDARFKLAVTNCHLVIKIALNLRYSQKS